MGEVIRGRFPSSTGTTWVTKKQLASHPDVRRSPRWLEMRVTEGLPSRIGTGGRREFELTEALAWIAKYKAAAPRGGRSGEGRS